MFLFSTIFIGVFLIEFLELSIFGRISAQFHVSVPAAVSFGVGVIASVAGRFFVPKQYSTITSFVMFIITMASLSLLVLDSGGLRSAYLPLWVGVGLFSGVFGLHGLLITFFLVNLYLLSLYITGNLGTENLLYIVLSGELPLIASYLLFGRGSSQTLDIPKEHDPTTLKQVSSELSELADQSEVIINAIGDGVIAVDAQGIVRLINPAAQQLLGWRRTDALTLNYKSVLNLSDVKNTPLTDQADPIVQVLNTNQQFRVKHAIVKTKTNKQLSIALSASPVGQSGSGAIIVFRDITKDIQEEREQAEFISTASHEMRTPVASIEGYLGLALNPATAQIDQKARDYIQKAHESAEHLGRLFQDLLDVSKTEDGRLTNVPRVINLVDYTATIVEGLRPKAQQKGLTLTFAPLAGLSSNEKQLTPMYFVNLDKDHIREVIANLTENGIKYTMSGEVVINITGDEKTVTVSIQDSGIGIPVEDIPHLFQKFYRVDNSETREIGGTGLGLYLCRRLTEAMGGRIWAESEYKKGSTFFVQLPRITTQQAEQLKTTLSVDHQSTKPTELPASDVTADSFTPPTQPLVEQQTPANPPTISEVIPTQSPQTYAKPRQVEHNLPVHAVRREPQVTVPERKPRVQ